MHVTRNVRPPLREFVTRNVRPPKRFLCHLEKRRRGAVRIAVLLASLVSSWRSYTVLGSVPTNE